jgi:hypothetical protein
MKGFTDWLENESYHESFSIRNLTEGNIHIHLNFKIEDIWFDSTENGFSLIPAILSDFITIEKV